MTDEDFVKEIEAAIEVWAQAMSSNPCSEAYGRIDVARKFVLIKLMERFGNITTPE